MGVGRSDLCYDADTVNKLVVIAWWRGGIIYSLRARGEDQEAVVFCKSAGRQGGVTRTWKVIRVLFATTSILSSVSLTCSCF